MGILVLIVLKDLRLDDLLFTIEELLLITNKVISIVNSKSSNRKYQYDKAILHTSLGTVAAATDD